MGADMYLSFIRKHITYAWQDVNIRIHDTNASLSPDEVYVTFQDWYNRQTGMSELPTLLEFTIQMCKKERLGLPTSPEGRWLGIKFKNLNLIRDIRLDLNT
jgi:hypothetical protein